MIMDDPRKETAAPTTTLSIHSNKNITHHLIFRYCDDGPVQNAGYFPPHLSGEKGLIQTEDGILGASIHIVLIIRLSGLARSPPRLGCGKAKNGKVGHRLIISHLHASRPRVCVCVYPVLGPNKMLFASKGDGNEMRRGKQDLVSD